MYFDVTAAPYNAAGDGIADDTAAILAANTAAEASGGVLYLPAGTYRTTATLPINPYRVSGRGDGPQLTFIKPELTAGQYAITLAWPASEPAGKGGPFAALEGLALAAPAGAGQPNGILASGDHAYSLTFRDVSISGFDTQVELGSNCYLTRFDRVFFNTPNLYGLRMDLPGNAGENISFDGCVFSGGPGTGVFLNKPGAVFYFHQCSFDYIARALWQRAGMVAFNQCHFETGPSQGALADEYLLVDRRGFTNPPMTALTDCDIYRTPNAYDTFIRLKGDNGTQGLRLTNPYLGLELNMCPYLIRDDGPSKSNIVISGLWSNRPDYAPLKLRKQDGTDYILTSAVTHVVV